MIELRPGRDESGFETFEAYENGEKLGFCRFGRAGEMVELLALKMNGESLEGTADGLLRASLNFAFKRGAAFAVCFGGVGERLLLPLGFKKQGGKFYLDLNESFLTKGGCRD